MDVRVSLLSTLSRALAPSGFEDRVRNLIADELTSMGYEPNVDRLGNLYVTLGEKRPLMVVAAHMDEVGFVVRYVEDSGFLRLTALGGVNASVAQGHEVVVLGGKGEVEGIIGSTPPHLQTGVQQKEVTVDDLFVDVCASSREEVLSRGVTIGSPVCFAPRFVDWGDCVAGKALDDRVGCYVLLEALREGVNPSVGTVVAAFTVQEETGLRGALALAHKFDPDYAVALEGTIANDVPGTPPDRVVTRMGLGPALRVMDRTIVASVELLNHLKSLAENAGVPYQLQISPYSGTDAGGFTHHGAASTAVSVPVRYIHSPVSVAKKSDIEHAVAIVKMLVENPWPRR
ncbi:MAG: M42 family metallopeptidase [Thermofilaceae archaeon]|nr:M42 family metallopeptidase [Thermofilaceae archaeon]MCX8181014.1 M42 family metallopeptidase [Thermofilaceae archaeon]MDW8004119.1 M42 family metallopeptidase [Thermofilaceae archaeon]